ncbi:alpha/beta hydrolase [Urechidicola vernalis]|uniref:Alpha/beta hydrolase-fold protein n=1 Tax=Urechidicola vernalis TaxID=3075600 RepID=A0ABU2Y3S7_9FLAO|nr:alpha/beta fold hydrolase [Urechidicola sp. P050]MDT0551683.1 alpha/beta hydrolase-fold protein [Urechidicola sp. P050]
MKNLSLEHVVRSAKNKTDKTPLLILLHGYGSNEQDLFSFASELPEDLFIVSARAPMTMNPGSYAWYTIHFDMNNGKFSDTDEAKESISKISTFIDEVKEEYQVGIENTFLLGFSQGTILSYAIGLNYPEKVQHIIALSGYINLDLLESGHRINNFTKLDFFCSHGTVDQVIPVEWAQNATPYLNELSIKNTYKEYMVGHGVAPQNFYDFKKWIEDRI